MKLSSRILVVLCLSSSLALAQSPEQLAEEHFNKGTTAYNLGRFAEAAEHFTKAYEAWAQNEFLYNIAQSYRLGGNCKQALHTYKRFKSLKETDTAAPMTAKKAAEIDKFIKELTECAAKADVSAGTQPDTLENPPVTTTTPTTTTTTPTTTTPTTTAQPTTTASTEEGSEPEEEPEVSVSKRADTARLISARVTGGISLLGSGDLDIPVQPSFNIVGGYPLPVGPMTIEVGAGFSYTPLPYEAMGQQERGTMFGARAVGAAVYPVIPKLFLRGELGVGIAYLGGLVEGNPISEMQDAKSFTLPSFRFGVAADYEVVPNIFATVAPFAIAFSPGADGMYGDSLREISLLLGVGYRQ